MTRTVIIREEVALPEELMFAIRKLNVTKSMNRYLFITSVLMFFAVSCGKIKDSDAIVFDINTEVADEGESLCNLKENIGLVNAVTGYAMATGDSILVLADGKNAFLYDVATGEQKCQLGSSGRARGETIMPTSVYVSSEKIYIWCSSLLKLVEFDIKGNYITEHKGFTRGARHFAVDERNRIVYMYTSGIAQGAENVDIIQAYDMKTGHITNKFGARSGEDEVMAVVQNSGGICCDGERIIYINPAHPYLYAKEGTESEKCYKVSDTDFIAETVENSKDITGSRDRNVWFAFAGSHSFTTGVYCDNDHIYETAIVGKKNYDDKNTFVDKGNSHNKIYIFDKNMNPVKSVSFINLSLSSMMVHNGRAYYIDDEIAGDDRVLTLKRIKL